MEKANAAEWLVAIGTCSAVLVAIFGPAIRSWWRRPVLSLQQARVFSGGELIFTAEEDHSRTSVVSLQAVNHGRSQADEVEAILSANQRFGPVAAGDGVPEVPVFMLEVISGGALQFELGRDDDARINIPPRSARIIHFVMLGADRRIREELSKAGEQAPTAGYPAVAMFMLLPAPYAERSVVLPNDEEAPFEIQLQARNARARAWRGKVKIGAWNGMDEDSSLSGVSLEWVEALKRARPSTPPTPRRAWLRSHTPRALWRDRKLKKEMAKLQAEQGSAGSQES